MSRKAAECLMLLLVVLLFAPALSAGSWIYLGPDGGDARSLAYDPQNPARIFLGTSAGELFVSNDGGGSWTRFAHLGGGDDYVLDHIVIHPSRPNVFYVGGWSIENDGGDVFRSVDGGKSWQPLAGVHGKSIRALAVAPSDPKLLVIGALDGVFRSRDGGDTWERISPSNHAEIKNIESLAIDPKDPNAIYAGTWHLPWKTNDGGAKWHSIKQGVIDDSDVFSIIINRSDPAVVYLSACSGIYKSENAGELFHKAQGIPFSARRTRVLHQDPTTQTTVYAGTTEGLWRTLDAGKTWTRLTAPNVIVNDVLVDPRRPEHVLLATDRGGVVVTSDGGRSFVASNRGFAHRQVSAVLTDRSNPDTIYAGLINDKEFGGVFVSRDAGASWQQMSAGLGGRDVFTLQQAESGALLAGTNRGVYEFNSKLREWKPINTVLRELPAPKAKQTVKSAKTKTKKAAVKVQYVRSEMGARVNHLEVVRTKLFAATTTGLYASTDGGRSWMGGPVLGEQSLRTVCASGEKVMVATHGALLLSTDSGAKWSAIKPPTYAGIIEAIAFGPGDTLWLASRGGAYRSADNGVTWEHVFGGLPGSNLGVITYDAVGKRLLAASNASGQIFESTDGGKVWSRTSDFLWPVRTLAVARGRVLAATAFDGILAQPAPEIPAATEKTVGAGIRQ